MPDFDLERYVRAQDPVIAQVLSELRNGEKRSHWMWFVFPQIAGLGLSETARFYALSGLAEARAYLAHPVLGSRLAECTAAMLGWAGKRDLVFILGPIDALKFASSMTLFEAAGGGDLFTRAIAAFCDGLRDNKTLALLAGEGQKPPR